MQKSIIERVFPKPKRSILPSYNDPSPYQDENASSSQIGIKLQSEVSSSRVSTTSSGSRHRVKAAPLSVSVIHHDDPFLAVDRATQNLQRTIQSLLDLQSQSLSGRTQQNRGSDTGLREDTTPTQSTTGHSDIIPSIAGSIPIRQPRKKNLSLRGARRRLTKSMQDFATLKEEELKIIQGESTHRKTALNRIAELEARREAVEHELTVFRDRSSHSEAHTFRSEADKVEKEIHELEGRLMELKARQRHLTRRAEQIENTTASELSSYEGTLKLVDKETRAFLRHPPVAQALSSRGPAFPEITTNIYLLTGNRRNLVMAKDQWTTELDVLTTQEQDVERDRDALLEGADMWRETIAKVETFEQDLRGQMKGVNESVHKDNITTPDSTADILASLDATARFLQQQLKKAESQNWNLLICAIGAELEAFREARLLIAPDEPAYPPSDGNDQHQTLVQTTSHESESENSDVPHADLLSNGEHSTHGVSNLMSGALADTSTHDDLQGSNESLKMTLNNLSQQKTVGTAGIGVGAGASTRTDTNRSQRSTTTYSESEDDDPGPEFLLSH